MPSRKARVYPYRGLLRHSRHPGFFNAVSLPLLSLWLLISLAGCSPIVAPTPSAAAAAAPPQFDVILDANTITIPNGIPAGVVELTMANVDTEPHTGLLRRLNPDQTLEEFQAEFERDPRSTMPMTEFLGGPDVYPGNAIRSYYTLEPGTYILVDNLAQPWHYATFAVTGEAGTAVPPTGAVNVKMREYAYDMPASIPSGKHLWEFSNAGESLHHIGIIQLKEDETVEASVAWMKDPHGDPPGEDFAWWNLLSPGVTSWGEIDLPPGEYYAIDLVPDFVNDGVLNAEHGMVKAITVTP